MAEKVLVVDDERQIRDLLGEFLEREGYEVFLASAGEESLQKIKGRAENTVYPSHNDNRVC
jgi:DNA-binding response OmpR family regulator